MAQIVLLLLTFLIVDPFPLWSGEEDRVMIYSDASPRDFGKSWKRQGVRIVSFHEFTSARTLSVADPDGALTAVLVDAKIEQGLRKFLEGFQERWMDPSWIWGEKRGNRTVYTYFDPSLRLQVSFSLEKPNEKIFALIDRTYAKDPTNRREVREAYQKNYVVRIHAAENIFEPWLDTITFDEVLLAATLVGDTFQPLLGIHDGCGLLQNLPDRVEAESSLPLVSYRPIQVNKSAYHSFILRVHRLAGSFSKNLWNEVNRILEPGDIGGFQVPEELIVRKKGRDEEKALLFYDVLTRIGYETRLVGVRRSVGEDPFLMVLYRAGGRGNWGAIWVDRHEAELAADWKLVPSILLGGEPLFVLIDPLKIFQQKRVDWPEPSQWMGS
ncbi:MAG: hypothetical protein N2442_06310 [Spirochaetes bacterium]|nr:hypothetical protein [Spirochaetota bacterium]